MPDDVMGASQMLEELAIQFHILDESMDLEPYKIVIIPESFQPDAGFAQKLEKYLSGGGSVIAFDKAMLSADKKFPNCFGVEYLGDNEYYPDFIIAAAGGDLSGDLEPDNEYVIYKQGSGIKRINGEDILKARAPYFPRKGDMFCSHRYTPSAGGEPYTAAVKNGKLIYFSHPLFTQYHENAPRWCKTLVSNAIDVLLPQRLVRHNGPSTLAVSILEQPEKQRYAIHLLSYIPVRKSAAIDIIEDRTPARDISLKLALPRTIRKVMLVPEKKELQLADDNSIIIPIVDGYGIIELSY
jgi:hypothetical protein